MRIARTSVLVGLLTFLVVACTQGGASVPTIDDLPDARVDGVCSLWAACPELTRPYDDLGACEQSERAFGELAASQECVSNVALVQCIEALARQRDALQSGELSCESQELFTLTLACDRVAWDSPCGR